MDAQKLVDFIKKNGGLGVLCVWLVWMNFRLNSVEEKLFNCYESSRIKTSSYSRYYQTFTQPLAILPKEIKIKKDENNRENKG